jgi:CheY-specific phosphatase CheX
MNLPHDSVDQICEWLAHGVTDATSALFNLEALKSAAPTPAPCSSAPRVITLGGFAGDLNCEVRLTVSRPFASILTSRMLSLAESEVHHDALVNDVVAELTNMISGSVKSRLCDSGIACGLKIPSILDPNRTVLPPDSAEIRQLHFSCGQESFSIELAVSVSGRGAC